MNDENLPPPAAPAGNGRRWLAMLALSAAIAVCSMIIGATGTVLWLKSQGALRHHHRVVAETVGNLKAELRLSPEQIAAVEQVVQKRYDAVGRIREEMLPRVRAEYEGLRDGVGAVLTPEQRKKWDAEFASLLGATRLFQKPNPPVPADQPAAH
jgi:hypothetical protein